MTVADADDNVSRLISCIANCNHIIKAYAEKVNNGRATGIFFGVTLAAIHALKGALLDEFEDL